MDGDQAAVWRLRAAGRSYRQIAAQLGIPLTRAYKLGTAPPADPVDNPEAPVFGCAVVCSGDLEPAPPAAPPEPPPAPAETPPPAPRGVQLGYLHGPFTMPTPEELARPYTMPGPGGTVLVVTPEAGKR